MIHEDYICVMFFFSNTFSMIRRIHGIYTHELMTSSESCDGQVLCLDQSLVSRCQGKRRCSLSPDDALDGNNETSSRCMHSLVGVVHTCGQYQYYVSPNLKFSYYIFA